MVKSYAVSMKVGNVRAGERDYLFTPNPQRPAICGA